jgi:hypothetical protein
MGNQPGPGPPSLNRQRGHRRLDNGLAEPAAQLGTKMLNDLEARRNVFQHITLVLPDAAEHGAAAARANTDRILAADLRAWFEAEPWRTSAELFGRLRREHPDVYASGQLRTLQRRLNEWRREMARLKVFGRSSADEALGEEPETETK